jgi:hypothetical protein
VAVVLVVIVVVVVAITVAVVIVVYFVVIRVVKCNIIIIKPVVPHKAVAEVSKIGNL